MKRPYNFRKAAASEAKPLVGLYAESGGGKTHSALLLACGFVGGDMSKVAMIETESGRGEAWADDPVIGGYQVLPLREEFSPATYGAAIAAAEREGFHALIIDSASHEWEGVGGVLDMAAKNQADGKTGQLIWQKPKIDHAREFMLRLTQTPIALVVACMRAKYPMEQVTAKMLETWDRPGKPPKVGDWIRSGSLSPKQSDDILFEMFVHGWIDKEEHKFHGTKYTVPAMRNIFIDGQPISVDTGKRLAAWSARRPEPQQAPEGAQPQQLPQETGEFITAEQVADLEAKLTEHKIPAARLCAAAGAAGLKFITKDKYSRSLSWIDRRVAEMRTENANAGASSGQ